jgi:hypothetical protein
VTIVELPKQSAPVAFAATTKKGMLYIQARLVSSHRSAARGSAAGRQIWFCRTGGRDQGAIAVVHAIGDRVETLFGTFADF